MKKLPLIIVVTVALLCGFGAAFVLTSRPNSNKAVASNSTPVQVDLKDDMATPSQVTIPVGQTVQFNTKDDLAHEMSLGEGNGDSHHHEHEGDYSSGEFGKGEAWKVNFKKAGTFTFHDHKHPNINVLVVAYQPNK